ncbi:MAG: hypothetical protein IJ320_07900, partial [Phascolarctobacterium sp.]|nr:hypothetical protein [Phascolarctobacterium sp.]
MSKKMLKRSLALGALMAFVITGSAMAGEFGTIYNEGTDSNPYGVSTDTTVNANMTISGNGDITDKDYSVALGAYGDNCETYVDIADGVTLNLNATSNIAARNYGIMLENGAEKLIIKGGADSNLSVFAEVTDDGKRAYGIRNYALGGVVSIDVSDVNIIANAKKGDARVSAVGIANYGKETEIIADKTTVSVTGSDRMVLAVTNEYDSTLKQLNPTLTIHNLDAKAKTNEGEATPDGSGLKYSVVRGVSTSYGTTNLKGKTTNITVENYSDNYQVDGVMTQGNNGANQSATINFDATDNTTIGVYDYSNSADSVNGLVASGPAGVNLNSVVTRVYVESENNEVRGVLAQGNGLITSGTGKNLNVTAISNTENYVSGLTALYFEDNKSAGYFKLEGATTITATNNGTGRAYGVYGKDGADIDLADTTITATSKEGIAYGVYAKGENTTVDVLGDLIITATGDKVARGIEAREGSSVTIGTDAKTNNVTINAVGTNENASDDWVIGVFSRHDGSEVNIKGDNVTINATATGTNMASGILANTETTAGTAKLDIDANNIIITVDATTDGNAAAITTMSGSETNIKGNLTATGDKAIYTRGNAKTVINESGADTVVLNGDIAYAKGYNTDTEVIDAQVIINLNNAESALNGSIYAQDLSGKANAELKAKVTTGTTLGLSNGATWNVTGQSFVNNLKGDGGIITVDSLIADQVDVISNASTNLTVNGTATVADEIANSTNTSDALQKLANTVTTTTNNEKVAVANFVTTEEGLVGGAYSAQVDETGKVITESITQQVNTKSDAVSDAGMALKAHWRAHMNDMNKRMGDLRMANGETGVWTRMVRGESEYQGAKMQYNQYQLGYDEKLSVDKRWTVGAAVTFSEGDASYGYGSTDDKSTAFAIYGSKLNNDGTFV